LQVPEIACYQASVIPNLMEIIDSAYFTINR
jgi:hypothetical protein